MANRLAMPGSILLVLGFAFAFACEPAWTSPDAKAMVDRASKQFAHLQYRQAKRSCDYAIRLDPEYLSAYVLRAQALTELDDKTAALADLDLVIKHSKSYLLAYQLRARISDEAGNTERALDDITKAIDWEKAPIPRAFRLEIRAAYYRTLGRLNDALADLNESIKLLPNFTGTHTARGKLYSVQGQYQKAVDDYTVAINLSVKDDDHDILLLRAARARALEKLGRHAEAVKDMKIVNAAAKDTFGSFFPKDK